MCGIFCMVLHGGCGEGGCGADAECLPPEYLMCQEALHRRGPDCTSWCSIPLSSGISLFCTGHVLWLQGESAQKQPLVGAEGSVLMWNGDVFGGLQVDPSQSDTCAIKEALDRCESDEEITGVLSKVLGPWALIYFSKAHNRLYFGRDFLGRQCLLWAHSESFPLLLSSVGMHAQGDDLVTFQELPALGLFAVGLDQMLDAKIDLYPWSHIDQAPEVDQWTVFVQSSMPTPVPMSVNHQLPVPEEVSAITELHNQMELEDFIVCLGQDLLKDSCLLLLEKMQCAVRKRVECQPRLCRDCPNSCPPTHTKVAVLFSGGIDSTIVALLADKFVTQEESIDLLNVAFEQEVVAEGGCNIPKRLRKRQTVQAPGPKTFTFDAPDRLTGRGSVAELRRLCPHRKWNFIEINVTKNELNLWRKKRIASLVHPLCTILDDSLGCALWFASRGSGCLFDGREEKGSPYTSPARVLLTGMGADEQLGGYSSHKYCYSQEGWTGLAGELERQLRAISHRNLGRDGRVIGDHGRAARYPFLDEGVVNAICGIPLWHKLAPTLPRGVGEKMLLRVMAATQLGLNCAVATNPKRALQFGTRIAKLEGYGKRASDLCSLLMPS